MTQYYCVACNKSIQEDDRVMRVSGAYHEQCLKDND